MVNLLNSSKAVGLFLLFVLCQGLGCIGLGQKRPEARKVASSVRIEWKGQQGVSLYRLQLSRDPNFTDIVFDRKVRGREYVVTELPPGDYYWHVAPAAAETGHFSPPQPVQISPGPVPAPSLLSKVWIVPANTGWRTATGNVAQPIAAHLRSDVGFDVVGVNSDGMVFALDGTNGTALWAARFRPNARKGESTGNQGAVAFTPLLMDGRGGLSNVIVAFEGGVRALEGSTGRELWRASLTGRASSGLAADLEGTGTSKVFIVDDVAHSLVVLSGDTGKQLTQSKLESAVIGAPVALVTKNRRAVLLGLDNGMLDMRTAGAERIRAVKFDTKITTAPIIVVGPHGTIAVIGTESGLLALDAAELKPLGRVATESDPPRGALAAADLDGSGAPEIVMITRGGRVVVVNTSDGKIKWYVGGATDATRATFADLNGDGVLDIIVAAGPAFALALSGKNGDVIWQAQDGNSAGLPVASGSPSGRALMITNTSKARTLLVGTDPARSSLRAVDIPLKAGGVATQ